VVMNILELIEKNSGQSQGSLVYVYKMMYWSFINKSIIENME
jgi:hypothetical protein